MFARVLFSLLAFSASVACIAQQPASPIGSFGGRYMVTDIVGYGDISGGEPAAKKALGKVLTISADSIDFDGEHCAPNKGFKVRKVKTAPLLLEYYGTVTPVDVGLSANALLLDSENCTHVFRMDNHRVVFGWDGVVVRAIRDDVAQSKSAPEKKVGE
jgi:hypothetical protein